MLSMKLGQALTHLLLRATKYFIKFVAPMKQALLLRRKQFTATVSFWTSPATASRTATMISGPFWTVTIPKTSPKRHTCAVGGLYRICMRTQFKISNLHSLYSRTTIVDMTPSATRKLSPLFFRIRYTYARKSCVPSS
jgi:hypothetical protein